MLRQIMIRLLEATPRQYLNHLHTIPRGTTLRAGSISTALCGTIEFVHEDASPVASRPTCSDCVNKLVEQAKFLSTELRLIHEMLNIDAEAYEKRFPLSVVIPPREVGGDDE